MPVLFLIIIVINYSIKNQQEMMEQLSLNHPLPGTYHAQCRLRRSRSINWCWVRRRWRSLEIKQIMQRTHLSLGSHKSCLLWWSRGQCRLTCAPTAANAALKSVSFVPLIIYETSDHYSTTVYIFCFFVYNLRHLHVKPNISGPRLLIFVQHDTCKQNKILHTGVCYSSITYNSAWKFQEHPPATENKNVNK